MKRKLAILLAALLMLFVFSGFSAETVTTDSSVYADGFLSAEEIAALEAKIETLENERAVDMLIVFTDQPESDDEVEATAQIANSYMARGGGLGETGEVILLYVDMKNRAVRVFENNELHDKFLLSESETDAIVNGISADLTAGAYAEAASKAVDLVSSKTKPGFFKTVWSWLIIGLGGAGAASGIAVGSHSASVPVSKRQYMKGGKVNVLAMKELPRGTTTETRHVEKSVESGSSENGGHGSSANF